MAPVLSSSSTTLPFFSFSISSPQPPHLPYQLEPSVPKAACAWRLWVGPLGPAATASPSALDTSPPLPCFLEAVTVLLLRFFFLSLIFLWGLLYDQGFCFLQQPPWSQPGLAFMRTLRKVYEAAAQARPPGSCQPRAVGGR